MYHDYAGQEIEDIEMSAMRQDARAKVTPQMVNDAYCHIEPTATEYAYLGNDERAKYQEMAIYLNQRLDGESSEPHQLVPLHKKVPMPAEPVHYHIELWFYDPRQRPVRMCNQEPDYRTRFKSDDIWSVGSCPGSSLTAAGCVICNPPNTEEEEEEYEEPDDMEG